MADTKSNCEATVELPKCGDAVLYYPQFGRRPRAAVVDLDIGAGKVDLVVFAHQGVPAVYLQGVPFHAALPPAPGYGAPFCTPRRIPADRPAPAGTIPAGIAGHEGKKYLRTVRCALTGETVSADVYEVLSAWGVTCPATQHALKKLLAAGQRGKGDRLADLRGALAAVSRAIELEEGNG